MTRDDELQTIQRKVYMTFFEDGVWDILLGLFVLGWGLSILTDGSYMPGVVFVCLYLSAWGIKKWLTYPRIGYARLNSTSRRAIKTRFVVLLTAVLLLGLLVSVLFGIGSRPPWLVDYFPLMFSGMLAAIVCFAAYWARINRFYFHAALIFLGGVLCKWPGIPWEFSFIGAGAITTVVGLGFLARFLRKYPRMAREDKDAIR